MQGISQFAPTGVRTNVTIGTYNVHDIQDTVDDPDWNDRVNTPENYEFQLKKAAAGITAMGKPDIVGIQEIESQKALDDLLAQPALAGYRALLTQGNDLWQHNNAFLYKADRIRLDGVEVRNPRHLFPDGSMGADPRLTFSTPPSIGDFTLIGANQAAEGAKLTVVHNHMKSKLGGVKYDPRRLAQGNFVGSIVDEKLKADPKATVVVMGDLNAFKGDAQFEAIMTRPDGSTRMVDVADNLAEDDRYTYLWRTKGRTEYNLLDHILVSANAADRVTDQKILHFNTRPDLAKVDNAKFADGGSDHDPIIATLRLPAPSRTR